MHQLCQLCFFIISFENMSTLPNFAQLCPTMHFSHSLKNRLGTWLIFRYIFQNALSNQMIIFLVKSQWVLFQIQPFVKITHCAAATADNFLLKTILITHYTRPRTASQGSPHLYVWLGCGLQRPQCCTLFNISEKVLIFFKSQTGSRSLHSNCTHNL